MIELTDDEVTALIVVRKGLADGRYKHFVSPKQINYSRINMAGFGWSSDERIFDMSKAFREYECGSVGCIFGWMWHELGREDISTLTLGEFVLNKPRLNELFYAVPTPSWYMYRITPQRAVRAIDNYIMGIDPIWGKWTY